MSNPRHGYWMIAGKACSCDRSAHGNTQPIGQRRIKACPALGSGCDHRRIDAPILSLLQRVRFDEAYSGGEVLQKTPAMRRAVAIDHADLVVAQSIDSILV